MFRVCFMIELVIQGEYFRAGGDIVEANCVAALAEALKLAATNTTENVKREDPDIEVRHTVLMETFEVVRKADPGEIDVLEDLVSEFGLGVAR